MLASIRLMYKADCYLWALKQFKMQRRVNKNACFDIEEHNSKDNS